MLKRAIGDFYPIYAGGKFIYSNIKGTDGGCHFPDQLATNIEYLYMYYTGAVH